MKNTTKNLVIAVIIIVAIIAAVLIYQFFIKSSPLTLYSTQVKQGSITESVNLSGQVKASQGVDLTFQTPGQIVANYVKVGDKIYTGEPLVAIDSSGLQAQLKQAQAQLDALNINTVNSKNTASLQAIYAASLSAAQKSASTAKDALLTISDIQFNHFTTQTPQNSTLQNAKAKAVNSLLGQPDAGMWTSQNIATLNGGAYGLIQSAINNPTQANVDSALSATQSALQDGSNLINAVPIDSSLSSAERGAISTLKAGINVEIITTSGNIQAINSLKVNNSATVTTTNAQIEAAQANIDAIKTQISKTVLTALFSGQVDIDNAVVGALASPAMPVITISNNNLEIDTSVPEIDIANVKIGDDANVTLDAYGNDVVFPASVISIDSAPSIVNGISVYGAKLKFKNFDDRIKPGMTANITVVSATHQNVLTVPLSAVIQQNGKYFVILDKGNSQKQSQEVTIGLRDNKNIEITSGLKLGDKIFAY